MRILLAPLLLAVSVPALAEANAKISTLHILFNSQSDRRHIRYYSIMV